MKKIIIMLIVTIFSIQLNAIDIKKNRIISIGAGLGIINIQNGKDEFGYLLNTSIMERYNKTNYFYGAGLSYLDSQDHYKNLAGEFKIGYDFKEISSIDILTKLGIGYAYNKIETESSYGLQYSIDNIWSFSKLHSFGYKFQINEIDIYNNKENTYSHLIYFSVNY